jgi:hypothetical protein
LSDSRRSTERAISRARPKRTRSPSKPSWLSKFVTRALIPTYPGWGLSVHLAAPKIGRRSGATALDHYLTLFLSGIYD